MKPQRLGHQRARRIVGPVLRDGEGQEDQRQKQKNDMQSNLNAWGKVVAAEMGADLAKDQHCLKEQHCRRPDCGGATDLRQDLPRVKRLEKEQKERRQEDCQGEQQDKRRRQSGRDGARVLHESPLN
jgi:hypothetical protein